MEISISGFLILSAIYFIATHIGLYKIFEKMGEDGWKALVPFYSTYLAVKMVKKSWLWIIVYYVPFLGFVVWMGIIVELMKLLGKTSFKEHFLGVVFAGVYLPYIGFKEEVQFIGYEEAAKYKKSFKREWADAIIFAVVAATVIRGLYLEAFTIPTSSMEQKLLVGDFLFVNKMAYGARVPNTPLSFPFTHHSFPDMIPIISGNQSYVEWFKFPYAKLPKMGDVERNDCVVFNFPAGDTVATEEPARIYEQMLRDASLELNVSENQARKLLHDNYTIKARPVDKKENYIKRCVGVPGDKLEIVDATLMINGEVGYFDEGAQFNYLVTTNGTGFNEHMLKKKKITTEALRQVHGKPNQYIVTLTNETAAKIKQYSQVVSVEKQIEKKPKFVNPRLSVFPNDAQYNWTIDNFGPILIPKAGATVELNTKTLPIYRRIIKNYEGNDLKVEGNTIYINGKVATSYTFKMDYFWMMGDNRHNSQDSRYWGFVPEDHIVGKAVFVWMSWDSQQGGIRWDRLFSLVH
ncbi:MAG: signal peptidase I [Vicingaceae bacterium]